MRLIKTVSAFVSVIALAAVSPALLAAPQEPTTSAASAAAEAAGGDANLAAPETQPDTQPAAADEQDAADVDPGMRQYMTGAEELPPAEPPDGEWLKDDDGRRYFLWPLSKDQRWYRTGDGSQIRYGSWEIYDLDHEAEDVLWVRSYERQEPRPPKHQPTAEEIAALEAELAVDLPTADRLEFRSFDAGLPKSGQWRNGFELADVDGDGHLDIVHGQPRKQGATGPVVFLGDGAGHWKIWQESRFAPGAYSYGDAAVADFNGDGIADVALGMHLLGQAVLIGDGKGGFRRWSKGIDYEVPGGGGDASGFSSRSIAVTDWNGDGRVDLIALGEGPRPAREGKNKKFGLLPSSSFGIVVYLNQGDGTWERYDQGRESGEVFGDAIALGDFDGDGRLDVATASNTFDRPRIIHLRVPGELGWTLAQPDPARRRGYLRAVATGDFSGDGRSQLAVSYQTMLPDGKWWNGIDLFSMTADGSWQRRGITSEKGRDAYYALATGDLDGDGALDLVALTDDGETEIFLGDGAGFLVREASPEIAPLAGGCRGYGLELADLDGDGRDEFVESFAGEPSAMFAPDRCPTRGALRAWDAVPPAPAATATAD